MVRSCDESEGVLPDLGPAGDVEMHDALDLAEMLQGASCMRRRKAAL